MKAIILAAGCGTRLRPISTPKCLLKVRGRTLLDRLLTSVQYAGVRSATCVVGYRAEEVIASCRDFNPRLRIDFVANPNYARGGIVSLHAARAQLDDDVLILNASTIFPFPLLKTLVEAPDESGVLFDPRVTSARGVGLTVENERVVDVGRAVSRAAGASGASLGLFKLGRSSAATLRQVVEAEIARDLHLECEDVFRQVVRRHRFAAVPVGDAPWRQVESPADWIEVQERTARAVVFWELAYARR